MQYIHFHSEQLRDLGFSLQREHLQANAAGAYCNSTIAGCNTRKYHGLLAAPQPQIDGNTYVLLSALDETLIRGNNAFQLGVHRYPGAFHPQGYAFLDEFICERAPQWTIRAGDILLKKELLLAANDERIFVRYTAVDAQGAFTLRLEPFLVFRCIHALAKANAAANRKSKPVPNGVKLRMYDGFSELHMQLSRKPVFAAVPDWYYNAEYPRERERGYDCAEDIYRPGFFEIVLKPGDQAVFSAGLTEISPRRLTAMFNKELKNRIPVTDFESALENAADQFLVSRSNDVSVTAGFPWFGRWGRDTFIALPGLTLATGKPNVCNSALHSALKMLKDGVIPNMGDGESAAYNSADSSLWFFWALQQYAAYTASLPLIWKEYGAKMRSILEHYRDGTLNNIKMLESGLLRAGATGSAVTWMDAVVDGKPVTPRIGAPVELNALWYNAVQCALEAARAAGDRKFVEEWEILPLRISSAFMKTFWDPARGYFADCAGDGETDWSLRPNQIIALSLPYSPVASDAVRLAALEAVEKHLLTPRGLRTLSPGDLRYKGVYGGNQRERDMAYHQGTAWPWLLGHFAEAYLNIHGDDGKPKIRALYENFVPAALEYGIGTIAEIYDGDPPFAPCGAISQAWSVAELLRIRAMLGKKYARRDLFPLPERAQTADELEPAEAPDQKGENLQ